MLLIKKNHFQASINRINIEIDKKDILKLDKKEPEENKDKQIINLINEQLEDYETDSDN